MKALAKELSRHATLFGALHITCTVPELSGEYTNLKEFQAAAYKHNKGHFHLSAIELIGWLNKLALYEYFGQHSANVRRFVRQLSDDFVNFWNKAPELQAEITLWVINYLKSLRLKQSIKQRDQTDEYLAVFEAFYDQYLKSFEPYNNPELCR